MPDPDGSLVALVRHPDGSVEQLGADRHSEIDRYLNAIMKRHTAFTVILMVPTLIAGIYGMNFELMPELAWPLGYPYALGLMLLAIVVAVTFFRGRNWF